MADPYNLMVLGANQMGNSLARLGEIRRRQEERDKEELKLRKALEVLAPTVAGISKEQAGLMDVGTLQGLVQAAHWKAQTEADAQRSKYMQAQIDALANARQEREAGADAAVLMADELAGAGFPDLAGIARATGMAGARLHPQVEARMIEELATGNTALGDKFQVGEAIPIPGAPGRTFVRTSKGGGQILDDRPVEEIAPGVYRARGDVRFQPGGTMTPAQREAAAVHLDELWTKAAANVDDKISRANVYRNTPPERRKYMVEITDADIKQAIARRDSIAKRRDALLEAESEENPLPRRANAKSNLTQPEQIRTWNPKTGRLE